MERMKTLHKRCTRNGKKILPETECGCFYCGAVFCGAKITDRIREPGTLGETTARCPVCGIDSVLYGDETLQITPALLREMGDYWFGEAAEEGRTIYQKYKETMKEE